jgi:hypothetical protein
MERAIPAPIFVEWLALPEMENSLLSVSSLNPLPSSAMVTIISSAQFVQPTTILPPSGENLIALANRPMPEARFKYQESEKILKFPFTLV